MNTALYTWCDIQAKASCTSSSLDIIKHVQLKAHLVCVCVCVDGVAVSQHTDCSNSAKDKNHLVLNKKYTHPNIFIYHTCTLCTGIPPHPISQACKMGCLFTLKHGPKRTLILLLSLSLSIHLFPLSRRYQLEETDVSSCFTSWLNFFALWCFFLEWRPVSPSLRTILMTNTHGFQVTLFPSNQRRYSTLPIFVQASSVSLTLRWK